MSAANEVDVVYVDLIKDPPPPQLPEQSDEEYVMVVNRWQPYRWHSKSDGNFEILGQGERYFNEAAAEHAIRMQYGGNTMVYLRRAEQGNELLRAAYPHDMGQVLVLGPECIAQPDGSVINWRGVNYVPQAEPTHVDQ